MTNLNHLPNSFPSESKHPDLVNHPQVKIEKYENNKFHRGLYQTDVPFPVSPVVGPIVVEKPVFGAKNYYWCSCGMSRDQPFCDSSHKGTLFEPIKFSLD